VVASWAWRLCIVVHILKMRRSIESAGVHIDASVEAILESRDVLKRVRDYGF
jgi:hypothetical protein